MEKILDNKKNKVVDALKSGISKGAKISTISAYFTIYAYNALKDQLKNIDEFRFLFVEPTFIKEKEERREFYIRRLEREKRLSGTEFEIRLKNELTQSKIAKECADWIRDKADFRSLKKSDKFSSKLFHVSNQDDKDFSIHGSIDFTSSGLGSSASKRLEMSQYTDDTETTKEMLEWFDDIWKNKELVEDVKGEVLKSVEVIYHENSPEFVYFVTLYNIFYDYLEEISEEGIVKEKTGFNDTLVWNKLYKFQKDGVIGAISKLEQHNGCIIADSVGLGKTFEALAVIKYYELRNDRVLVMAPKKLRDNWALYRLNDVRNILEKDRFSYDILNHTDLSRERGFSGDINLETVNWGNYDLVVIDESHNFRNYERSKGKKTRYDKLMADIIKAGVKTKVLMLSATPINNKMNDLKNQVAFITEGNNSALQNEGIGSIENTLKFAQTIFNKWQKEPEKDRTLENLLNKLNVDYFKLLDSLTIARSRKHIEKYYDLEEIGDFPERMKPTNHKTGIDLDGEFPSFEDVNNAISRLNMAMYSPLFYVLPDKRKKYEEKYDIELRGGKSKFTQMDRETQLVNLMRINILKRLESSIYAYVLTVEKMLMKTKGVIDTIVEFEKHKNHNTFNAESGDQEEAIDGDDEQLEDFLIGNKIQVSLEDVDVIRWKQDLEDDLSRFDDLLKKAKKISVARDEKLYELKKLIQNKIENPINDNNKKILVFSAFADTANYLYKNIADWVKIAFDVDSALVTGGGTNKTTAKDIHTEFNSILTHFSPISKEKDKVYPKTKSEIDIMIATDCISEGQNLQDCDTLVNYDIHWNPVRIIQRFGRIDRIGSKNTRIKLINFWPNMELDAYIKLEQRVRGRMILLNSSATGEDDIINETDPGVMNDIEYRKKQLVKLQDEVVDLEDISGGVSITDLTMNDFKMDLLEYIKTNKEDLEKAPLGMYAVADGKKMGEDELKPGVIFTLKQVSFSEEKSTEANALHPYYMVYITDDGEVSLGYVQAKYILDIFKKLAKGTNEVIKELVKQFDKETKEAKDMSKYSKLLMQAVSNIIGKKQDEGIASMFTLGETGISSDSNLSGLDDFELISFLVIK
ncbi:MAG: DEAD/DEAH box helicase family protein [Nanoarchaeota archaeon]|nr:DEAD/DEAH box helicase family protein [Nanoarchaeota archaeon]